MPNRKFTALLLLSTLLHGVHAFAEDHSALAKPEGSKVGASGLGISGVSGLRFFLRRDFSAIPVLGNQDRSLGANLSFSQNRLADLNSYNLDAAAILGWRKKLEGQILKDVAYSIGFFGQVRDGTGVTAENRLDSFGLGVGAAWVIGLETELVKYATLDAHATWQTNGDGELSVYSSTLQYQPFLTGDRSTDGFNFTKLGNKMKWHPKVTVDYHKVNNDAGIGAFSSSDDFLYLGAGLGFDYEFLGDANKAVLPKISIDYDFQYDVIGRGKTSDFLSVKLSFPLISAGETSIDLTYERGQSPRTKGEVDHMTLGLALKL